ncbi:hypothetical protein ACFW4X_15650 [Streptomyces smyrnaeus]|uniref:Ricin B lectin domain-containing protein n=1 Tax=Streptomyces smyrnaeus TaxID=1387713 RepID=A0ABS3XSX9_9ACTN|nr:hypothetical protein [Streptomyces smyrnaeus]MBO8198507.1 hypothetical protein [Streptomyces smyrnaeus]
MKAKMAGAAAFLVVATALSAPAEAYSPLPTPNKNYRLVNANLGTAQCFEDRGRAEQVYLVSGDACKGDQAVWSFLQETPAFVMRLKNARWHGCIDYRDKEDVHTGTCDPEQGNPATLRLEKRTDWTTGQGFWIIAEGKCLTPQTDFPPAGVRFMKCEEGIGAQEWIALPV